MSDVVFGRPAAVGLGMAWTWVRLDKESKKPIALGVGMTETALEGLPAEAPAGPMRGIEFRLELPDVIKGLPYDHVALDYNPQGHIPPGIYDVPHFDIHFYTISPEQRYAIKADEESKKKGAKTPDPKYVLPGYILPPDTFEPMMGTHWIHPASPELNGKPFTTTFLYGSYDGRTAFLEPMVTTAFLKSKPDFKENVPIPAAFEKAGYYPSAYRVYHNAERREYHISLEGLTYFKAGPATKQAKK